MNFESSATSGGLTGGVNEAGVREETRKRLLAAGMPPDKVDDALNRLLDVDTSGRIKVNSVPTALATPTATPSASPTPTPPPESLDPVKYVSHDFKGFKGAVNAVAPSPTDKALQMLSMIIPGLGEVPEEAGPLARTLGRIPETSFKGALARTGLGTATGAVANAVIGQSPIKGALKGAGSMVLGELPGMAFNPSLFRSADQAAFSKTIGEIVPEMGGLNAELASGKNPINVLRDLSTREELNARYGKALQKIDDELGGAGITLKGPRNQPMDFMEYKRRIDAEAKKGWSMATHAPLAGNSAATARTTRQRMVASLQKQLETIDQMFAQAGQNGLPVPPGMKAPGFSLANAYRDANRQYEKVTSLIQLANDPSLLDYSKLKTEKAQELFRGKFLNKLQSKLGPIDAKKLESMLFRGAEGREAGLDRPGYGRRMQGALYGGSSSLRMRLPIPNRAFPNISNYVGTSPRSVNWLRALAEMIGEKGISAYEGSK